MHTASPDLQESSLTVPQCKCTGIQDDAKVLLEQLMRDVSRLQIEINGLHARDKAQQEMIKELMAQNATLKNANESLGKYLQAEQQTKKEREQQWGGEKRALTGEISRLERALDKVELDKR